MNDDKKYRLPWEARLGRWWRAKRETIGLVVVAVFGIGAVVAFISGNAGFGTGLAVVGVLYLIFAYSNWFNDMS